MRRIDDYIKCTRILKPNLYQELYLVNQDSIEAIYNMACTEKMDYPELVLCNSISKACEMVELEGEHFFIYDYSLNNALCFWNLMLFSEHTTKEDVQSFRCKMLSEAYVAAGDYDNAIIPSLIHRELVCRLGLSRLFTVSGNEDEQRKFDAKMTLSIEIQNLFIMLHELKHWILHRSPRWMDEIEYARMVIKEIDPFVCTPEKVKRCPAIGAEVKVHINQFKTLNTKWYDNDCNIEETLCDKYAFEHIVSIYPHIPPEILADYCLIGLNNIEQIENIKLHAGQTQRTSENKYLSDMNHRKTVFMLYSIPLVLSKTDSF